jgi:ubiquinone/menaquinone biosynthesis C-methylase UbiE/polysaccharide pyruvyl transferase WcaK-like protein
MGSRLEGFIRHIIYKWIGIPNFIRRIEWAHLLQWLDPKEGEKVLDIACGEGTLSLKIAERGCIVCGIDISENVINGAKQFARREKIACEFQVGDAERLPYPDGCFDKVVCSSSLEHFDDDLSALKEMSRVLKPNGIIVLTVDSLTYPVGDEIKERHRKLASVITYYTSEALKQKLEIVGFNVTRSKYLLNSHLTNYCCKLGIRLGWQGILWFGLFPLNYLCLISDKLFGDKDKGYTLIVQAERLAKTSLEGADISVSGSSPSKCKILLIGWYGHNAIGDDMLAYVIKHLFSKEAERKGIEIQFAPPSILKNFVFCRAHRSLVKNDLIVIGGGSIIGFDTMHLNRLLKGSREPLVIFGGGFRKEAEKIPEKDRIHMTELFSKASLKGVRGPITCDLLISNGIAKDIDIVGDPALSFSPPPTSEKLGGDFRVGVNVRFMKTGEPQYLSNAQIYNIFAKLADYFVKERNAQIYLFSFTENKYDSDTEAAKKVIELMKYKDNPKIIPFSTDIVKMCSLIGSFDYLISQRLHPCILGWVQKVPNIGFEYQFLKTADFMSSIGMDEFTIRTDEFSLEAYLAKYEKLTQNKQSIIESSQQSIAYWRKKQKEFVNKCLDIVVENRRR